MLPRNASATFKVVEAFTNGLPSLSPPGQKPILIMLLFSLRACGNWFFTNEIIFPEAA